MYATIACNLVSYGMNGIPINYHKSDPTSRGFIDECTKHFVDSLGYNFEIDFGATSFCDWELGTLFRSIETGFMFSCYKNSLLEKDERIY